MRRRCPKFNDRILNQSGHFSDRWMSLSRVEGTHQVTGETRNEAGPVLVPQCMMGEMPSGKLLCCRQVTQTFREKCRKYDKLPSEYIYIYISHAYMHTYMHVCTCIPNTQLTLRSPIFASKPQIFAELGLKSPNRYELWMNNLTSCGSWILMKTQQY